MNGITVLILDDNPLICEGLSNLLRSDGFKVVTSESCVKAFSSLFTAHPNVLLVDLQLPGLTGIDFIDWVRERPEFTDIPIIAMTGCEKDYLEVALLAGATAALHKPEDLDNVIPTIEKVVAGSRYLTASSENRNVV
ncbi:MAG TPA: response regulator [Blastocatellia bacterium]|nr:response regulator [Blastocatellia bacterium]